MDPSQLLARLKALAGSMSVGQIVTLALTFVLVVGVMVGSAYWLNKPTYTLLFADMDAETAGQIVTKLKTQKVPYQLDEGGRGIRVPSDRVDELRISLTTEGMPASGRIGFEIFDRTAFGATEFLEQVNYRRALEGEIARTITTISEVASARVHIAMGKDSLFGESRPAKASVVLKLRSQRSLATSTVSGISNLVAGSVEGLRPEAVVILDSFGRPLARPQGDEGEIGAVQTERQQRLEREMSQRVVALLEPVVGAERVRVNVALKLNPETREETEERYDPNAVVRSRQTSGETAAAAGLGQIAGARGNQAPSPSDPAKDASAAPVLIPQQPTGPGSSRTAETTNYEVSRVTRHTIQPPGDVARISLAVILDDDQAVAKDKDGKMKVTRTSRKREDLQKIQALVAAAVGLEPDRGDQITVENVSFEEPIVEEPATPTMFEKVGQYAPQLWEAGRILATLALGIIALMVFVRPLMQRAGAGNRAALAAAMASGAGEPVKTVAELEAELENELDANGKPMRKLPVLTKRIGVLTAEQPDNVAKLLRSWMQEPGN
jgi:flagellar M-ring protein FliF